MIENLLYWLGNALIVAGAFFALTGALGLLRMPDFFSRLHPAGVADSLAVPCVLAGLMCHAGLSFTSAKLLLLMLFVLLTSCTACHALAKAAFLSGLADEELEALKAAQQGEAVSNITATGQNSEREEGSQL